MRENRVNKKKYSIIKARRLRDRFRKDNKNKSKLARLNKIADNEMKEEKVIELDKK